MVSKLSYREDYRWVFSRVRLFKIYASPPMPLFNAPTHQKELARQGQPEAIASVVNHAIQSQGITAKAVLKDGSLLLLLESADVPDEQSLVPFIKRGLSELGIESLPTLKIYGRQQGQRLPAWQHEIELEPLAMEMPDEDEDDEIFNDDLDMPPDDQYIIEEEETLDEDEALMPEGDLDEAEGDIDEEYYPLDEDVSLEEEPPPKKWYQNKVLLVVPIVLVVLLAGGAGAFWYLQQSKESATTESTAASVDPQTSSPPPAAPPPASTAISPAAPPSPAPSPATDPFGEAVRRATQAANLAQNAQTQAEWIEVANLWQQASELMGQVPQSSPNYDKAQPRVAQYEQNMNIAKQKAASAP